MTDLVTLLAKRNRGWPWPEDSWGLSPMFGADGWCHGCGVPSHEQSGSLVLQRKGFKEVAGAWLPHWQYNAFCMESSIAEELAGRFNIQLRDVAWHGSAPGRATQIVVPTTRSPWFDAAELRKRAIKAHGSPGNACPECGTWRWYPLDFESLPPIDVDPELASMHIAASPEWFGDGWNSFHEILMIRELAEALQTASPRDFTIGSVQLIERR